MPNIFSDSAMLDCTEEINTGSERVFVRCGCSSHLQRILTPGEQSDGINYDRNCCRLRFIEYILSFDTFDGSLSGSANILVSREFLFWEEELCHVLAVRLYRKQRDTR